MSKHVSILVFLVLMVLGLLMFLLWPQAAAQQKSFAQCLTEEGVIMYGVDTCPKCADQKKLFGEDFDNIEYVNCAFQTSLCKEKGVTVYPIWAKGNDVLIGLQSFAALSDLSGCPLPS